MAAEDLLVPAQQAHASRVEILVTPKGSAISQTVDGIAYKREPLAPDTALAVVDYFKSLAGLDVKDRRRRQMAEFDLVAPTGRVRIHLTTAGSSTGLLTRVDFDLAKQLSKAYDSLGLLQSQMEGLRSMTDPHDRHGVVLVGAPKGQGLTTSAYGLLNRHDAYTANIKTLEREILLWIDGVDQVRWDSSNPDVDYPTNLQSILRRDPDIVLTDVLQDSESGRIIAEPGLKGPLVYVQQRHGNIVDQVREWVKLTGDVKRAAKSLRAVMNQRLIRKLCPNCKQAYKPTPEQVRKLNLPAGKVQQLFRAGGKVQEKNRIENCPVCAGSGYLGQTGIFEVMILDDEGRKLLAGGDMKAVLAHARRNKMIYLQEAALAKVVSGETSIEEVLRVTAPPKQPKPAEAAA
jgi:type II secretory ATPase GspE/PulE/Tfp pilus assembly ATPase PilB-like protein